ncbi:MAG: hypothetical protein RDU89_08785 [bacterium]|nr:hypothetical protein [bacterium]
MLWCDAAVTGKGGAFERKELAMMSEVLRTEELSALAKSIAEQLSLAVVPALAAAKLPTFDISAASKCCEGHCPCDSRNGSQCPCNSRCACDGKLAHRDDLDMLSRLACVPQAGLKSIMEAAPLLQKLRMEGAAEKQK